MVSTCDKRHVSLLPPQIEGCEEADNCRRVSGYGMSICRNKNYLVQHRQTYIPPYFSTHPCEGHRTPELGRFLACCT